MLSLLTNHHTFEEVSSEKHLPEDGGGPSVIRFVEKGGFTPHSFFFEN